MVQWKRADREKKRAENPQAVVDELRDQSYRRNYGITLADYKRQLARQCGLCAICQKHPDEVLRVDHCHTTGAVRGLLCNDCNLGLGRFYDQTDVMRKAITYLDNGGDYRG